MSGGSAPDLIPEVLREGEAWQAGVALSRANAAFYRFVQENPEALERRSFEGLDTANEFLQYPFQGWPIFATTAISEEFGRATDRIAQLVRTVPQRFFGNSPARLAERYRLDPRYAALLAGLLAKRDYVDGFVIRGDFLNTAHGFQCLELNMGGNLGGWKAHIFWSLAYEKIPLFRRFLEGSGIVYRNRSPHRLFFAHLLERARQGGRLGEVFRIAFIVSKAIRPGSESEIYTQRELDLTLAELAPGVRGEALVCENSELVWENGSLNFQGRPVHAVSEQSFEKGGAQVVRALLAGAIDLYNGPASYLLADKRNLALLSEHQEGDLFDREERATIAAHVPWTREVRPGPTIDWEGARTEMTDLLLGAQDRLVLKPASGAQGRGVSVGPKVSREVWEAAVADALGSSEPWVVQRYFPSLPYLGLNIPSGCSEHDVIWGMFVFGSQYGGCFLRMKPKAGSSGIINSATGATDGALMETDE